MPTISARGASSPRRAAPLERATDADAASLAQAREEVLIAEGSDWCWWYGDDHSSAHDIEFDELFRRHLRNVYKLLGMPVPDELFVSNISTGVVVAAAETSPSAFFTPTLDGEETSYFEWLGAGAVEVRGAVGRHAPDRWPDEPAGRSCSSGSTASDFTSGWTVSGGWPICSPRASRSR